MTDFFLSHQTQSGDFIIVCLVRSSAKQHCVLSQVLGERDHHGNTPLHLAIMLGKRELVYLLLAHGAPVKIKNKLGWSPLAEAIRCEDSRVTTSYKRLLRNPFHLQLWRPFHYREPAPPVEVTVSRPAQVAEAGDDRRAEKTGRLRRRSQVGLQQLDSARVQDAAVGYL